MPSFLAKMKASFPKDMPLPTEFEMLFAWMEANDFVRHGRDGLETAAVYPRKLAEKAPFGMEFEPVNPELARVLTNSDDPAVFSRLAPFVNMVFGSSHIALWRDDAGRQKFVHFGSESNSWVLCTLADNPVDALRFLAIGYVELRRPEDYEMTPEEVYEKWRDEDDPPYVPPLHFRKWVEDTFGVDIPGTASAIVTKLSHLDDADSDDPFWYWIWKQQGRWQPSSLH
jgi:hypothetical protein